jgi:hypothetical protein
MMLFYPTSSGIGLYAATVLQMVTTAWEVVVVFTVSLCL